MKETKDLIIVTQLPIIEQTLKQIGADVDLIVANALSIECTAENKQEIKQIRTDLNNRFKELEEKRKSVKNAIMKPYDDMESIYKQEITTKFNHADEELALRISKVEIIEKKMLEDGARLYFDEYLKSKNINFISFEDSGIKVTLSNNPTQLKKMVNDFIDKIASDIELIEEEELKSEILVEYKKSLNVSASIIEVKRRTRAIEEEKIRQQQILEQKQKVAEAVAKVEEVVILSAPATKEEKKETPKAIIIPRVKIVLINETVERIKELQKFLKDGGYNVEQNN